MNRRSRSAGSTGEGAASDKSRPDVGKSYYDIVRSISKDPEVLRAVTEAERNETAERRGTATGKAT